MCYDLKKCAQNEIKSFFWRSFLELFPVKFWEIWAKIFRTPRNFPAPSPMSEPTLSNIHRYLNYLEKKALKKNLKKKEKSLHVKLTLLTKLISLSYKLALLIHQDMCLVQRWLKYFFIYWAVEGMAQDCSSQLNTCCYKQLTFCVTEYL